MKAVLVAAFFVSASVHGTVGTVHRELKAGSARHAYFSSACSSAPEGVKMGLASYTGAVSELTEEIRESFSGDERDDLFALLRDMGMERWDSWKVEQRQTILRYVMSTPAQRSKLKVFQSNRLLLAFAAYQHSRGAQVFLQAIDSNLIYPGGAYRQMAGMAGMAYQDVLDCVDPDLWPWGEDHPLFKRASDQE
jgi:hypothetical protein